MGLIDRIKYRRVDRGLRNKDGKVYKKFVKRPRLPSSANLTAFFSALTLVLLILGLMVLRHYAQPSFTLPRLEAEVPIE